MTCNTLCFETNSLKKFILIINDTRDVHRERGNDYEIIKSYMIAKSRLTIVIEKFKLCIQIRATAMADKSMYWNKSLKNI